MQKKKIIVAILCIGLIAGSLLGTVSFVRGEGQANANVINILPAILAQEIRDGSYVLTNTITPKATCYLNVSIYDADGVADILNTTVTLHYSSIIASDDPLHTYMFCYNESQGTEYQVYPTSTADTYLQNVVRTSFGANTVNYSFEIALNGTAVDSNGNPTIWNYELSVEDNSADPNVTATNKFTMAPYVELTYWGNAGGMNFTWNGTAESNQSASFNTLVTSNDNYQLNCSFTGTFQAPWGTPSFWIKQGAQPSISIPNASSSPGLNSTWYTSTGGSKYMNNLTHTIALVFPPGITKAITYAGVTIWIQARND